MVDLDSDEPEKNTNFQIARDAKEHVMQVTKAILQCMLNPDGVNYATEKISFEDLARGVDNIFDGDEDANESGGKWGRKGTGS